MLHYLFPSIGKCHCGDFQTRCIWKRLYLVPPNQHICNWEVYLFTMPSYPSRQVFSELLSENKTSLSQGIIGAGRQDWLCYSTSFVCSGSGLFSQMLFCLCVYRDMESSSYSTLHSQESSTKHPQFNPNNDILLICVFSPV